MTQASANTNLISPEECNAFLRGGASLFPKTTTIAHAPGSDYSLQEHARLSTHQEILIQQLKEKGPACCSYAITIARDGAATDEIVIHFTRFPEIVKFSVKICHVVTRAWSNELFQPSAEYPYTLPQTLEADGRGEKK